ncbi:hypothetical protein GQX74_000161 [Glossina fuscipes]|nr:hypothetical protein GQX74_000161 [Glossina fuscipes]
MVDTSSEFYDDNRLGVRALRSRIAASKFNGLYNTSDVDDQISTLNSNLDLIHRIKPKVKRGAAVNCESWLNCNLRNLAYKAYLREKNDDSCLEETRQQVQETQEEGQIGFYLYKKYFKAGGGIFMFIVMLTFCIMSQILGSAGDYFLSYCTEVPTADNSHNIESQISGFLSQYNVYIDPEMIDIYVFTIITVATIAITVARSYLFFNMAMKASTNAAAMYFFNTNSSGRILNRFSKDMGQIDEILPSVMIDVIQIFLTHSV